VRLRFPGYEHTKISKGVPEGWKKDYVPELIEINPKTRVSIDKDVRYVPMAALSETSMVVSFKEMERREKATGAKFRNGDTLFPRITPCLENGKTAFVNFLNEGEVACGSTEFIVLRGKNVSPEFVYCFARTYDFRENAIKSMIGSSGRQRVQETCFDEFPVLFPSNVIMYQFNDAISSVFKMISVLHLESEKLRQARDLLLPKLMGGEVEVNV
jgi:type I restriction enzyme S subunit